MIASAVQRILLQPEPSAWADLARRASSHMTPDARAMRTAMGLPIDRPVIAAGHAPIFWHAGILAKYIAAAHTARAAQGLLVNLIVDHEAHAPTVIDAPARDSRGQLVLQKLDLAAPASPAEASVLPECAERIQRARATLADSQGTPAQRVVSANALLLRDWFSAFNINASAMLRTPVALALLDRMLTDPIPMATAYNEAVREHTGAGVPPLRIDPAHPAQTELPLWLISPDGVRRRLTASEFRTLGPDAPLAPRALLLTATARLGLCDLFVHGVGGGLYDRATTLWIKRWLNRDLAPVVVATADVLLPIDHAGPSAEHIDRSVWIAHHARHDPALLGASAEAERKIRLLHAITLSNDRAERSRHYRELHDLLSDARRAHAAQLAELDQNAASLQSQASSARVAARRDWPAILHPRASLDALASQIATAFRIR